MMCQGTSTIHKKLSVGPKEAHVFRKKTPLQSHVQKETSEE